PPELDQGDEESSASPFADDARKPPEVAGPDGHSDRRGDESEAVRKELAGAHGHDGPPTRREHHRAKDPGPSRRHRSPRNPSDCIVGAHHHTPNASQREENAPVSASPIDSGQRRGRIP